MNNLESLNASESIVHHLRRENESLQDQIEHYKQKYSKLYQMFESQKEETLYWMEKCQKLERGSSPIKRRNFQSSLGSPSNAANSTPIKTFDRSEFKNEYNNENNFQSSGSFQSGSFGNFSNNINNTNGYNSGVLEGYRDPYKQQFQNLSMQNQPFNSFRNPRNEFKDTFRDSQRETRNSYLNAQRNDMFQFQRNSYSANNAFGSPKRENSFNAGGNQFATLLPPINDRRGQLPPIQSPDRRAEIKISQPPGGKSSVFFG